MKRNRIAIVGILFFAIFTGFAISASALDVKGGVETTRSMKVEMTGNNQVVQKVSTLENEMIGHIDWENKIVYAVGDGVPPKTAVNPAQARALAKRAAIDTAMGRLLEAVNEVRVDSESTTRNYVTENYVVRTKVSGLVKNAVIEELRQAEDGSYQIKMSMPINGAKGLSATFLPYELKKAKAAVESVGIVTKVVREKAGEAATETLNQSKAAEAVPASAPSPAGDKSAEKSGTVKYSGLIVNAKGLGATPGLYPNIKTDSGKIIYNIMVADPNAAVSEGLCIYRKSLKQAEKIDAIGDSPLVVKASEVDGTNKIDVIIHDADGERISQANLKTEFLNQARVAIVID